MKRLLIVLFAAASSAPSFAAVSPIGFTCKGLGRSLDGNPEWQNVIVKADAGAEVLSISIFPQSQNAPLLGDTEVFSILTALQSESDSQWQIKASVDHRPVDGALNQATVKVRPHQSTSDLPGLVIVSLAFNRKAGSQDISTFATTSWDCQTLP